MGENDIRCLIWGTPATIVKDYRGVPCIDSPRAGGRYVTSGWVAAKMKLQKPDDATKAHLTSWLIEQRRLGEECPVITDKIIEDAKQRRDLTVSERADRLLQYLKQVEPSVGKEFRIGLNDLAMMQALSESRIVAEDAIISHGRLDEHNFFINYLEKKGWIKFSGDRAVSLTVDGYIHLEELERQTTDSSQAFVATWFDDSMAGAWEEGIYRGIKDAGYEPLRIDRKEHTNKIDDEIIAEIRRSRFIVADFTHGDAGPRGGVYYEAGFAHGLGIPVIFTCREDALEKVHFDTRQYNHIVWETPEELRRKLAMRIAAVIGDGPLRVNRATGSRIE